MVKTLRQSLQLVEDSLGDGSVKSPEIVETLFV